MGAGAPFLGIIVVSTFPLPRGSDPPFSVGTTMSSPRDTGLGRGDCSLLALGTFKVILSPLLSDPLQLKPPHLDRIREGRVGGNRVGRGWVSRGTEFIFQSLVQRSHAEVAWELVFSRICFSY